MSRTTQYIGLNSYATKWVERAIKEETYDMTTGMFDETIEGKIYYLYCKSPNMKSIFKEVVQTEPWSNGPMIFTCLQWTLVKESGQEIDMGILFKWMGDPSLKYDHIEVDYNTGRFYV